LEACSAPAAFQLALAASPVSLTSTAFLDSFLMLAHSFFSLDPACGCCVYVCVYWHVYISCDQVFQEHQRNLEKQRSVTRKLVF
jgi:hypothetical protein